MAALANRHKLGGLKQEKLNSLTALVSRDPSQTSDIKVVLGHIPSVNPAENPFLALTPSGGHQHPRLGDITRVSQGLSSCVSVSSLLSLISTLGFAFRAYPGNLG